MKSILPARKRSLARVLWLSVVLLVVALPVMAQKRAPNVSGRWIWKQVIRKNKTETQFRITIRSVRNGLQGTYSVDQFINGQWQGEDGNQTPFVGRAVGSEIQITFDPMNVHPGYEKNVRYTAPADGREASVAVITRSGRNLQWRLASGQRIEEIPATMVLRPETGKR